MDANKKINRSLWFVYLLIILWLAYCNDDSTYHFTVCPTKLIWKIPCPGCGVTRATLLFLHGNIIKAIALNPNVFFSISFIVLFPIMVVVQLFHNHLIYKSYLFIESCLKKPIVFLLLIGFEIIIEINNLINCI